MKLERLNFPPKVIARIDDDYLATTLETLNQMPNYAAMAHRTSGGLGDDLEEIYRRTMDRITKLDTHHEEVDPSIVSKIARLSFIDSFALPGSKKADPDTPMDARGLGNWTSFQRLFADIPNKFS